MIVPSTVVHAEPLTVAVAANFANTLRALEGEFEAATEHEVTVVTGSTGQLYAQIVNGAPFDILLGADQEHPRLLAAQGWGDPSARLTYAVGRLVLWSREPGLVDESTLGTLGVRDFHWLAIANPELAPYGAAARQTLVALGVWQKLERRIVRGQNVAQAFALAQTGNAELALVALSQALAYEGMASYAIVPAALHEPIRQDAIVLERAAANPAALDFMEFLRSPQAAAIIERHGYTIGSDAR